MAIRPECGLGWPEGRLSTDDRVFAMTGFPLPKIIRKTGEGEIEIRVKLDDLINEGEIDQNVEMQPGDVLIIPESFF